MQQNQDHPKLTRTDFMQVSFSCGQT